MTELLPNGEKVEVFFDSASTTTVPSGKVWVVTIGTSISDRAIEIENGSGVPFLGIDGTTQQTADVTVHENAVIRGSQNTFVTGWEFDYSA